MQDKILQELQALKDLTLLSAKKALTMDDTALLTGLMGALITFALMRNKNIKPASKTVSGVLFAAFLIIIFITLKIGVEKHEYGLVWLFILLFMFAPISLITSIIVTYMLYHDRLDEKEDTRLKTMFVLSLITTITLVLLAITAYSMFGLDIFEAL